PMDATAGAPVLRARRGARAALRDDRVLGVRQPAALVEPQGHRVEPVRVVLPRELAVLRPEHLRALPGRGDGRGRVAAPLGPPPPRRPPRSGGAGRPAGGARAHVLTVELRGAPGGARRAGRAAVGCPPRRLRGRGLAGGGRCARAGDPRLAAPRWPPLPEPLVERPGEAGGGRPPDVRRSTGLGVRFGV